MPLGFERMNVKTQPPNPYINFIKPLKGPDEATAHDFLARVAAICSPIMKKNGIRVMAIEEFPPNKEFLGRNFNAGECIQLVLKSHSGNWLPFRFVQRVMMHELAHNAQMNHSRNFWKVRNQYCEELTALWDRGYLGDGLWGRGINLYDGQLASMEAAAADSAVVKDLCGGTYRGRGKRRPKDKPKLTYAEREAKRIKKKFGVGGVSLGGDEDVRAALENGKKVKGKPKVAGSNRARELRAAAALARFGPSPTEPKEENDDDDFDDSDFDDNAMGPEAVGADGERVYDQNGHPLVRICEGADEDESRQELEELAGLSCGHDHNFLAESSKSSKKRSPMPVNLEHGSEGNSEASTKAPASKASQTSALDASTPNFTPEAEQGGQKKGIPWRLTAFGARRAAHLKTKTESPPPPGDHTNKITQAEASVQTNIPAEEEVGEPTASAVTPQATTTTASNSSCPVCTFLNDKNSLTCGICAHVLHPDLLRHHWKCKALECKGSVYVNAGDVGICGLCLTPKTRDGVETEKHEA